MSGSQDEIPLWLPILTNQDYRGRVRRGGTLQRLCLELLRGREDDPDGLPTSTRFLFYELVQSGAIEKHGDGARRADQGVIDAVFHLREIGLIPWEWIVDETRSLDSWRSAATVAGYLTQSVRYARIDPWESNPPMILTESRSLAGTLRNISQEYLVPIASTNGQCGGFLRTEVGPRLSDSSRVLYLGDFDWQGGQIERNTRIVLEQIVGDELDWERLAITAEQVDDMQLTAIRKEDRRYKPDDPRRFHDAVETEALGQSEIVRIVREHLDGLLPEPLEDVQEREAAQREEMTEWLSRRDR